MYLFADIAVLGLGLDAWLTLSVVLGATVLMVREKGGPDLVMFSALCVLVVAGILDPRRAMGGFADPATVTVGVLFVVARAIQDTGALTRLATWLFGRTRDANRALLRLIIPIAAMSAFLNNTPIVAMFIPVVTGFSRRIGSTPARFLMPMSFAAMLGGTCTLVGTSTNLVVSGLMEQQGMHHLGMFELAWVGLPTAVLGILFLTTVGHLLVTDRADPLAAAQDEAKEYLAEVEVASDSPMIGDTVESAGLRHLPGLFLVEIRRTDGRILRPVAPQDTLHAGDHLVLSGAADTIKDLTSLPGIIPTHETPTPGKELFEVVVSHHGGLVGRNVRGSQFRRRYDAAILAVHRAGERVQGRIGDVVLQPGDTLMLSASPGFRRTWQHSRDFYLVSELPSGGQPDYRRAPLALLSLGIMVTIPTITDVSMTVASMAALVFLLGTRCVSPRAARQAVDWPVLVLIGASLGVSEALVETGAATAMADALLGATGPLGPLGLLAGTYLLAMTFSLFISNAAAAALVFPIALAAAASAGFDPRPFAVAVAMAASAAFATPIGYQTNLLVYGPGGYRYTDFVRLGAPLQVLCFVIAMLAIPWAWPLTAP